MTFTLKTVSELETRANKLINRFSFKTEETMQKQISKRNIEDFEKEIKFMLTAANELAFITLEENNKYATDIFKCLKKLFAGGNRLFIKQGTSKEINNLISGEAQNILNLLTIIKENEGEFKYFTRDTRHRFNERWFVEIAKHIQIQNDVSIFINELNGGNMAVKIKDSLINPQLKNIDLYGIDRDIDFGAESRERGIESARGGLYESSSLWADISFCANHYINFGTEKNYYLESELHQFYRSKFIRNDGLFIFNYPFYKLNDIKSILQNNKLIAAYNTNDILGNIVFIMQRSSKEQKNTHSEKLIELIEFSPSSLPSTFETVPYVSEGPIHVKTFKGKYTDMDDIKTEFVNQEDSAEFLFSYYQPKNKLQQLDSPLVEYKPGHIPAMATSELINGRYVDETLNSKVGQSFEFDHLFSTKIVKREFEEKEEKEDKDGNKFIEVSEKKSNVIVSVALTAAGEYIELFSNDTDETEQDLLKED